MGKNINFLLSIFFLIACSTDVGIITVNKPQEDTSITTYTFKQDTNEDTTILEPSNEPGSEINELDCTVGLLKWELEQVICHLLLQSA